MGGVDATVMNETPIERVEIVSSERIEAKQIGDVVETTLPWKGEKGLKVKHDMGEASVYEKIKDKRKIEILTEVVNIDDGGFKVDFLLNEEPSNNEFCYLIEGHEDYNFYYQDVLTPEEEALGFSRPENVQGGYAVYHKTLRDNQYQTGKAMQIYRPQVWEYENEDDTVVWAELTFDEKKGELCVVVDKDYLKNANYPVRVDPTFGYTSIGASTAELSGTDGAGEADNDATLWGDHVPIDFGGKILVEDVVAYMSVIGPSSSTIDVYMALWDEDSDGVDTHGLLAQNTTVHDMTGANNPGWYTNTFNAVIDGTNDVILSYINDPNDYISGTTILHVDSVTEGSTRYYGEGISNSATAFADLTTQDPWVDEESTGQFQFSIYANYSLYSSNATTEGAIAAASSTATLSGNLQLASSTTDVGFDYGIGNFGSSITSVSGTTTIGLFSSEVTGLTEFGDYQFRAWASSSDGILYGDTYYFYTADVSTSTPVVTADNHLWDNSDWSNGTNASTTIDGDGFLTLSPKSGADLSWSLVGATTTAIAGDGVDTLIDLPGTVQAGDLVIVVGASDLDISPQVTGVDTAGYTTIYSVITSAPDATISYKILDDSETQVTLSTSGYFSGTGRDAVYALQVWRGVDIINPIETALEFNLGTTSMPNPQLLAAGDAGRLMFAFGMLDDDDVAASVTAPATPAYTNLSAQDTVFGDAGATVMMASRQSGAATNPTAFGGTGDDRWHSAHVAFNLGTEVSYEFGEWTAPALNVGAISAAGTSKIGWVQNTPGTSTVAVKTAINSSAVTPPSDGSFTAVSNQGTIAGFTLGEDLTGKYLWVQIEMTPDGTNIPTVEDIYYAINRGGEATGNVQSIIWFD